MMSRLRDCLLAGAVILAVPSAGALGDAIGPAGAGPGAPAAAAQDGDDVVADVLVTARYRAERLIDVGQSVSALSGDQLSREGITDIAQLAALTPGLTVIDRGEGQKTPSIRGITRLTPIEDSIQSPALVGLYLDGVPISTAFSNQADIPYFDLEQVQVLRGPQGSLYGVGSMAGTVVYTTKRPDLSRYSGEVDASVGSIKDGGLQYGGSAMINIPLIEDKLGVRGVIYGDRDGGFIDNALARKKDANDADRIGGRLLATAKPIEGLTLTLEGQWDDGDRGASNVVRYPVEGVTNDIRPLPDQGGDGTHFYEAEIEYETGFGAFSSITGLYKHEFSRLFDDLRTASGVNALGIPSSVINTTATSDRNVTEEVRFVSNFSGPLQFTAGALYQRRRADTFLSFDLVRPSFPLPFALQRFRTLADQYALYGESSYALTDNVTIRAGGRFFYDAAENNLAFAPSLIFPQAAKYRIDNVIREFLPRFVAEYKPLDSLLLYGSISRGARNAGFNSPAAFQADPGFAAAQRKSLLAFDGDSVWTYELGTKTSVFDRRLQIDGAVYYTDWTDPQVRLQSPLLGLDYFGNARNGAHILGLDLEITCRPIRFLSLSAALGLVHSVLSGPLDVGGGANPVVPGGTELPNTRKQTLTFSASYQRPLNDDWSLTADATAAFASSARDDLLPSQSPHFNGTLPAYEFFNARIGLDSDRLSVSLFAENIFNKVVPLYVEVRTDEATINRPRVVGVRTAVRF